MYGWDGPWFNIKISYQYRKSYCGDKNVIRSYLHTGISHSGKMASLHWITPSKFRISCEIGCHRTSLMLMIDQYWFRQWLGATIMTWSCWSSPDAIFITLSLEQNGWYTADAISKCIFFDENSFWILFLNKIHLKFYPNHVNGKIKPKRLGLSMLKSERKLVTAV